MSDTTAAPVSNRPGRAHEGENIHRADQSKASCQLATECQNRNREDDDGAP